MAPNSLRNVRVADDELTVHVENVTREKFKEMFSWCKENCKRDIDDKSSWGTSWWTSPSSNDGYFFCFTHQHDAMMFRLKFG